MTFEPFYKNGLFLSRELTFPLKLLESATLIPPWPEKKNLWKIGNFHLKSRSYYLYLLKIIFPLKPIVILIDLVTFFHVKPSDFGNNKLLLSYT